MSFEELGLDSRLLRAVKGSGFQQPTDIQRQAIPLGLAGKDLMASAQTGTGKTAAFVLPSLQRLLKPAGQARFSLVVFNLDQAYEISGGSIINAAILQSSAALCSGR